MPAEPGGVKAPTLQQLMETISALQEANVQLQEELHKNDEDLRKDMQQRALKPQWERGLGVLARDCPEPFSRAIMDEPVPTHYVTPKITFSRTEDPENHLTMFNAQMIISRGSDAVRCKMFMGTFTGTAMQWFSGLPDGHITSFAQFAKLFREQFYANQVKPPELYDLFNVRQKEGETLKVYLNRFWALTVRLQTHDEKVMVTAFE